MNQVKNNQPQNSLAFLFVKIPAKNEAKASEMEEFLKALHRVLPNGSTISLEMMSRDQFLRFYIVIERIYKSAFESQLYSQYHDAEVEEAVEYVPQFGVNTAFAEVTFRHHSMRPIATHKENQEDFLKSFTAFLSKTDPGEEIYMQLVVNRVGSKPWNRGLSGIASLFSGKQYTKEGEATASTLKISQDLFRGRLLLAYTAQDKTVAKQKLNLLINLYKHTDSGNKLRKKWFNLFRDLSLDFKTRKVSGGDFWSPAEIATIYHFVPYKGTVVSNVVSTTSRRSPAPDFLPREGSTAESKISLFGVTNYRNDNKKFGILRADRSKHLYVVGKTGSGKTKLLELLVIADILQGHGCCFLDPHGDSADEILKYVPEARIKDVVYINPTDRDFPVGFNPLEPTQDYEERHRLAYFFVSIFKKEFTATWNPRMEHLIRFIVLALLETPDSNILGIERMLSDTGFRQRVIRQIQDPVVKSFWANEYGTWAERYANDAVVPILNKVGQFISNPVMRNMVGQTRNALDFEAFMNDGKIVVINMSKGRLGEENIGLLGSMFVTRIQQAALSRSKIREEDRRPFYFYVDEFQNFANDALATILSEARKYQLCMTIAHQYIAQLPQAVKDATFGNVGSLISFGVGGDDASYLTKELLPTFSPEDLINLDNRDMYLKILVNGKVTPPFSARTIDMPKPEVDNTREILSYSRMTYGKNRIEVEREIEKWTAVSESVTASGEDSFPEPIL
ncbi:MAG: hypothetical protein G01um10145_488 [Microgenomates group bacterium Gr01-1014_5]|nr:MAG: hypothetical protein G01um10145_488 [Microgenomates group bacterium Gr01-1014_5]